jgi:hypothetical protein
MFRIYKITFTSSRKRVINLKILSSKRYIKKKCKFVIKNTNLSVNIKYLYDIFCKRKTIAKVVHVDTKANKQTNKQKHTNKQLCQSSLKISLLSCEIAHHYLKIFLRAGSAFEDGF